MMRLKLLCLFCFVLGLSSHALAKEVGSMIILSAQITSVDGDVATISRGSEYGFKKTMKCDIMPLNKPSLADRGADWNFNPELIKPLGLIELTEVYKDKSLGTIIMGRTGRAPRVGDIVAVSYRKSEKVENGEMKMILRKFSKKKVGKIDPEIIGTIFFKEGKTFINIPNQGLEKKFVKIFSVPSSTWEGGDDVTIKEGRISGGCWDIPKTLIPNTPEFFYAMQDERTSFLNIDARIEK